MNLRGLMKQETTRRLRLVEELYYTKDLLSSEQLLDTLDCSLPALISDIRFLNEENLPLKITKNKGIYSIEFDFYATIDVVYSYILQSSLEFQVIKSLFFEKSSGIQLAADRLNCSFSNMQRYLKTIKDTMIHWNIFVNHRPLRLEGDEMTIRHFYYLFFRESRMSFAEYGFSSQLVDSVDQFIRQILVDNQITNSMTVHFQLMHNFLISLQRQKQGHYIPKLPTESGLALPEAAQFERLTRLIKRETSLEFDELLLRECLWPLFSHQLILNLQQQEIAQQQNRRLTNFYDVHYMLLERISELLITPFSKKEKTDYLRLLGNELFCYYPNKQPIEILQKTDTTMLKLLDKKFSREIRKINKIVSDFLIPQQQKALAPIYISCLTTIIDNLMQRLVAADKPLNVLLVSDTSTTHERFWHSIFPSFIKGSIKYDYFNSPFILQEQFTSMTAKYDLIITNVTMSGLDSACPLIAVNAYPTAKDFERIQDFINQFESLPSRKESYNELTRSS